MKSTTTHRTASKPKMAPNRSVKKPAIPPLDVPDNKLNSVKIGGYALRKTVRRPSHRLSATTIRLKTVSRSRITTRKTKPATTKNVPRTAYLERVRSSSPQAMKKTPIAIREEPRGVSLRLADPDKIRSSNPLSLKKTPIAIREAPHHVIRSIASHGRKITAKAK